MTLAYACSAGLCFSKGSPIIQNHFPGDSDAILTFLITWLLDFASGWLQDFDPAPIWVMPTAHQLWSGPRGLPF